MGIKEQETELRGNAMIIHIISSRDDCLLSLELKHLDISKI